MRSLRRTSLLLLLAGALSVCATAQQAGRSKAPVRDPGGLSGEGARGPGGGYGGPGDTLPTNPGGGPAPATPRGLPPGFDPNASFTPGDPYADGYNPLAPRVPPPGVDYPGSPTGLTTPPTPASRPSVQLPNSWKLWWHYNRWAHLPDGLKLTTTGSGGFYIGRGVRQSRGPLLHASRAEMQEVVQPALLRALEKGGRPELVIYSLQALAKLRDVQPDEELGGFSDVALRSLKSGNQDVAEKAVLALGVRGEDRFGHWLTNILMDTPEGRAITGRQRIGLRMRSFAAYGLGLLGERTGSPEVRAAIYDTLVRALWLERVEVQAACLVALGFTPMPVDDEFVGNGELFEGRTRVDQVLEMLSFFDDPEQSFVARSQAPTAIAKLLVDAPESLRSRAAYAFLVASGPHSKELREVQNAAVMALGRIGRSGGDPVDDQILDQLERIAYRSNADRSTRYFAMIALAEAAARRGVGEEPYERVEGARRLLLRQLGRARGETQAWTALALGVLEEHASERGELPSPESGKALRQIFQRTRSADVAGAIAIAMGLLRDRESTGVLTDRMIGSGEEHVQGYTALALGMIGAPDSIDDVRRVLTESVSKPFVVEQAAIGLALLGDQGVGARLFEILSKTSRPQVQASVASAMGWIKDPRPLDRLCRQLLEPRRNDMGRAWTSVAIGRICDGDAWPWVGRVSADAQYDVWLPTLIEPGLQNGLLDMP